MRGGSRRSPPALSTHSRGKPQGSKEARPKRLGKLEKARTPKEAKKSRGGMRVEAVGHSAHERRTRQVVEVGTRGASFVFRHRAGNVVILALILVAAAQLFLLQVSNAA